ncbi:MAG: hypothetical protein ACK4ZJ_17770, partial [Allorhizobium sp.]
MDLASPSPPPSKPRRRRAAQSLLRRKRESHAALAQLAHVPVPRKLVGLVGVRTLPPPMRVTGQLRQLLREQRQEA